MPTLLELKEQRAAAVAAANEYLTRSKAGDEMSGEDEAAWEKAISDVDRLDAELRAARTEGALTRSFDEIDRNTVVIDRDGNPGGSKDQYAAAFGKYLRSGVAALDADERALMAQNFRAQSTTTTAGGYTVPEGFWAKVTETLKYYGGIRQSGATVITTESGATLPWPTADDTGQVGAILGENVQIGAQDVTFGTKSLGAFMYTSKLILVSLQLLQDTGVDLEGFLARQMGNRLGRIQNTHFTTGTGTVEPNGVVPGASLGGTAAGTTAIIYEDLVDLVHSLDPAYRALEPRFMMHDSVLKVIRKLKTTDGLPLFQASPASGLEPTILGYPYVVNNDMTSTVGSAQKTILFGDFASAYVIREVAGGQVLRLDERYADYLQVGYFAFNRTDGIVQDSSAVKYLIQKS
jgi:HK97 family phage major capsid protein